MRTRTINGTPVEIVGVSGCNLVTVRVGSRDGLAQADAGDLLRPTGPLPPELEELDFHDPDKATAKPAKPAKPVEAEDIS